jgi:hypothetical protein
MSVDLLPVGLTLDTACAASNYSRTDLYAAAERGELVMYVDELGHVIIDYASFKRLIHGLARPIPGRQRRFFASLERRLAAKQAAAPAAPRRRCAAEAPAA